MKASTDKSVNQEDLFGQRLYFIAGPCVIESEEQCLMIARRLTLLADQHEVKIIFKASYDKANRTSVSSYRGPGRDEGLGVLQKVHTDTGLPICTDIHTPADAGPAAEVADIIQIPAFLCRQTDLLTAARDTGKYINIKKGQFMSPQEMRFAIDKAGGKSLVTERGTFFGYNRLVVDFAGIHTLKTLAVPVIFDATHSVQQPGGGVGFSSGNRELAVPLSMAAVCQGVSGLFFEVHPDPDAALCDGANTISLEEFEKNLPRLLEMHEKVKAWG